MSLRARLVIVIAVLLATYVATAFLVVSAQRSLLIDQVDERLRTLPPDMLAGLERPPLVTATQGAEPGQGFSPESGNPLSDIFVGVVEADGAVTTLAVGALPPGIPDIPDFSAAVAATNGAGGIVTIRSTDGASRFRAMVRPVIPAITLQTEANEWVVAAQSLAETDAAIARLVRTLWIAGAVIAVVLGVAYFWVERLGLRPIGWVTATAEAIAGGDRSHRVEVRDPYTEAGKLGLAFNVMLDERDASETRLRQFVADASHELRTPLTSVRGYLELYHQGAFQDRAQLDDVVRRLSAESARMYGLVEDLLALASLDERRPLREEPVDLGQLLRDAAQDAQAVQPTRDISVVVPNDGPMVIGDPGLLVQLVGILVSNALAHTPTSVPVTLRAASRAAEAVLTVADAGPGLDPEAATQVFDRFWRGEVSRARSKGPGGGGLGLAIARSVADAHGGTISLETAPGKGCTFTVRLPQRR